MLKPLGNYIGFNRTVTTDAASGVWDLDELHRYKKLNSWPAVAPPSPPTVVGLTGGSGDSVVNIPAGTTSGDLLIVMTNTPFTSLSGGASSWTTAFTTSGAGFGYEFRAAYGTYSSGSTITVASGYNVMCLSLRGGSPAVSQIISSFGLISNIDSGATSSTSIAQSGTMFGMATDRGSSASFPTISGLTFQQNITFSTTYFGCRAVVGTGYTSGTSVSVTDVNNVYGTQFCMGIVT